MSTARKPPRESVCSEQESNELMAHLQPSLWLPATGLRFFTVYGLGSRYGPDAFCSGDPGRELIKVFNHGKMRGFHLYRRYC